MAADRRGDKPARGRTGDPTAESRGIPDLAAPDRQGGTERERHQVRPRIDAGEAGGEGGVEAEAAVIPGVAENEDAVPPGRSSALQPRTDQAAPDPRTLPGRCHRDGGKTQCAERRAHLREQDMTHDLAALDGHERHLGNTVLAEPIHEIGLVGSREGGFDDRADGAAVHRSFVSDHRRHRSNTGRAEA